jgi:hypothetical protein
MMKTIYTAIAAPGAGKTKALITQLPDLIRSGEKIVLALPTLNLCDDVVQEMTLSGITPRVINSKDANDKSTANIINGVLRNANEGLIIVTHEGLRLSEPSHLRGYTLVIDEVPDVFELQHLLKLQENEAERIFAETEIDGAQLSIKPGRLNYINDRIQTYKASEKNRSVISTLSKAEFNVFKALLNKGIAHFDKQVCKGKTVFNFYTVEEKNIFRHIEKSKETHILAANIHGGLFDLFATTYGYRFTHSRFTPKEFEYSCDIAIYPMLSGSWSKNKVLMDIDGNRHEEHLGKHGHQIIDRVFANAINNTPQESFIVIHNKWGKFDDSYIPKGINVTFPDFDCRGLNSLQAKTAAILLFSGIPSPNDMKSLRLVAQRHAICINELTKAWIVKNKLEASLQAATRTAVRNRQNSKKIYLYVQDQDVAEYLMNTYMKKAVINHSLQLTPPPREDRRVKITPNQAVMIQNFINQCYAKGMKRPEINKMIMKHWSISMTEARRITRKYLTSTAYEFEGLERFLA